MQVSVEAIGGIGRRVTVAVPSARFEHEFSERLRRVSRNAKLPGFRPGKVPLNMVEAQFGDRVLQEVAGELVQATLSEALSQQGLQPVGNPRIEPRSMARGTDFEYTAVFEVYPSITRLDIKGAKIVRPVCEVAEADVDRTLDVIRQQQARWQAVARAAVAGDRLQVDFVGRMDGQPFAGGSASNFALTLGSGMFIPGFEDGLIGATSGETRLLDLSFPPQYENAALAGRPVQFEVTVRQVTEPVLPAVDGEFALKFGIADGTVESLRREVRANLEREMHQRVRTSVRNQVFSALVEANAIEIPAALIQAEADRLIHLRRLSAAEIGLPPESVPTDVSRYWGEARRRVAIGLILAEVVKTNFIVADPDAVRARIEQLASAYESPEEFVQWHYAEPMRLAEVESVVVEDRAVDFLLEGAEVSEKAMDLQELMKAG